MPALSERKIEIVRRLVETAPDSIVGGLQRALAETGQDTALADVKTLVEVEARDRRLRNAVLLPIAPLCRGVTPGQPGLRFPSRVLVHLWRGLEAAAPREVADAAESLFDYTRDEPPPPVFDQLAAIAAYGLRHRSQRAFGEAADLCDQVAPNGAEQLAACLDLAPVIRRAAQRLPEWATHAGEQTSAAARLAFKDAVAISEDAGPRFFEMLAAQLEQPSSVLRIISAVMDKPTERYLAESEMAEFGERAIRQIDEALGAIAKFSIDGGPDAGRAAARQVALITQLTNEVEGCVDLSRDHGWGKRLATQKLAMAEAVEARFKDAEKQFALALPTQRAKMARVRRSVPKLAAAPDQPVVNRTLALLTFAQEVRVSATYGGFASTLGKLIDKLGDSLDNYVEEVLDLLRTGDADADSCRAYLALCADFALLIRDQKAADLVRRRTVAACQDDAPIAQAG